MGPSIINTVGARIHASVNAAAPLVVANWVYLTSSYNTGALVLDATPSGYREVWSNDTSLSSQYASVMHRDGFLYGTRAGRRPAGAGTAVSAGHRQGALE